MENITIYTNEDGRTRAYIKSSKKAVSYPRLLMEEKLGRSLSPEEQVHHVDGNPLNNDIDNLTIVPLGEHQREHSTKYFDKIMVCDWCGREFLWTAKQQRTHYGNVGRKNYKRGPRVFCSKSCSGKCGRSIQLL